MPSEESDDENFPASVKMSKTDLGGAVADSLEQHKIGLFPVH